MIYSFFSLNGTWEMAYSEEAYKDTICPEFDGFLIENAVPGYWEDMTEAFLYAPFFPKLKINPEYGIQKYPIATGIPDMALPNIIGNFFYKRTFLCENINAPAVIHFDGVQNAVSVWLNGAFLGRHEGYSTPFDIEIPRDIIKNGENTIILSVSNHRLYGHDGEPIVGLTSRAANECTGGITGDLELRVFNSPLRDTFVRVSEDCSEVSVGVSSVSPCEFDWSVLDGKTIIKSGKASGDFKFSAENLELWSPENPKLYTLKILCGEAELTRKFGVRRLLADGVHLALNGNPCFLRGICEHCYFPETVHPTHDIAFYRNVIKTLKKLGFNFIRFHTFVPAEEYMQAADELGMLMEIESPNNTTEMEWKEIVKFCRRHTSTVMYSCGNELPIDDMFLEHLRRCSEEVHNNTDSLFSPMSGMRGLEYCWEDAEFGDDAIDEPFKHNPRRLKAAGEFCDLYNSFPMGLLSYKSTDTDVEKIDDWSRVFNKPRLAHELCIDGTYMDLSLKDRYKGTRIGKTEMFSSVEEHLASKGLLKNAPLYFKNSSEWQRRVRKHCFEAARRCENLAGFDFLGPIDTHWHTFGYDVGMMNEFYELKPGETIRNVLMYNSESVVLTDIGRKTNLLAGDDFNCGIYLSNYAKETLCDATLNIYLFVDEKILEKKQIELKNIKNGAVTKLYDLNITLPYYEKPKAARLYITVDGNDFLAENEWELYIFPKTEALPYNNLVVCEKMSTEELEKALNDRKDVLILGTEPFVSMPTSFRIAQAGRLGNSATVIYDHPVMKNMPHDGFCGWQFNRLLEKGRAVCFENRDVPFNPIIEVATAHKFVIRQSSLFEFNALNGRLLVCSFNFDENDPAAAWLKAELISYATSDEFCPKDTIDKSQFYSLINGKVAKTVGNTNFAFNPNDKAAKRRKK